MADKLWIQKAHPKKGALSRALGIKEEDDIPMELLNKIVDAKTGDVIENPTDSGKSRIRVTTKLQRQAVLGRNLKRLH